jgi:hypothetical protein
MLISRADISGTAAPSELIATMHCRFSSMRTMRGVEVFSFRDPFFVFDVILKYCGAAPMGCQ